MIRKFLYPTAAIASTVALFLVLNLVAPAPKAKAPIPNITNTAQVSDVQISVVEPTLAPVNTKTIPVLTLDLNRTIFFNVPVSLESVEATIGIIHKLNAISNAPIFLLLYSPGGAVFHANRLINFIEASKAPVYTIVYGLCASMCFHIHQHGKQRYSLPSGTLMAHQLSGGVEGQLGQMKSLLAFINLESARLDAYIADRAGIPREQYQTMIQNELWLSGEEAIKLHFVDKLVSISLNAEQVLALSPGNAQEKKTIGIKHNLLESFH